MSHIKINAMDSLISVLTSITSRWKLLRRGRRGYRFPSASLVVCSAWKTCPVDTTTRTHFVLVMDTFSMLNSGVQTGRHLDLGQSRLVTKLAVVSSLTLLRPWERLVVWAKMAAPWVHQLSSCFSRTMAKNLQQCLSMFLQEVSFQPYR